MLKSDIPQDKYDLSNVPDKFTSRDKLKIKCLVCNSEFIKRADMFKFSGYSCPNCNMISSGNLPLTIDEFKRRASEIHNNKYTYENVVLLNNGNKSYVEINCPTHGPFVQRVDVHLIGTGNKNKRTPCGCPKCGNASVSYNKQYTIEEFIERARIVHSNKYTYDRSVYNGSQENLIITCPVHGDFEQQPNNHLFGCGCPKCAQENQRSKGEIEIAEFVKSLNIEILENNRYILPFNRELDIYISPKKLAIEFDGIYYHSEIFKQKNHLINKTNDCESIGIRCIHVYEDEWNKKPEIVKSRISHLLGVTKNRIYARQCEIRNILDSSIEREFLEHNHIQGYVRSDICLGLYHNNELVSLMSFGKKRINLGNKISKQDEYELYRLCSSINYIIVGGAKKLFSYFVKEYNPLEILTFADRRYTSTTHKNVYDQLGFEFIGTTDPGYFYVVNGSRKNRFGFRKDILISKYGCKQEDTEHNFVLNTLGYPRIYDCGNLKYIWKKKPV